MYKTFSYLLLVFTVITTTGSVGSSMLNFLTKPAAYANNPCSDVRNGQFVCLDCSTLAYCVQEGGDWVTIEVAPCATERSMYCNEDTKSCTLQHDCFLPSRGIRFECQNPGKYPDPYDCKVYHICSTSNVDTRLVCPSGTIYSPASQDCVEGTTSNEVCRQAQFRCDRVGTMGSWPGDANIYYVCHRKYVNGEFTYYPLMYRCQTGSIFDGENCVSQDNTKPPAATTADGCIENKLSAHPTNCRAYYRCKNGKLIAEQCPQNAYFNAAGSYCDFGSC